MKSRDQITTMTRAEAVEYAADLRHRFHELTRERRQMLIERGGATDAVIESLDQEDAGADALYEMVRRLSARDMIPAELQEVGQRVAWIYGMDLLRAAPQTGRAN